MLTCPHCEGPFVAWYSMLGHGIHKQGNPCSSYFAKLYCCTCRLHFEQRDSDDLVPLSDAENTPAHDLLEEKLDKAIEDTNAYRAVREKQAKARVFASPIDQSKPRFSQHFEFVCPFCSSSEVIGLWNTTKKCSNCKTMIRIVRTYND